MTSFRTTLWSRLGDAADGRPTALDEFVSAYRPALVRFLAKRGLSEADAEDVAHDVFVRLLSRDLLAQADAQRGRFRNYLIAITLHVLGDRRRREQALKRGGGARHVPVDLAPPPAVMADFEDIWLGEVVRRALDQVAHENPVQRRVLDRASQGWSASAIAEELGLAESTARVQLHRGRKRLSTAIRAQVASYCSSEDEYAAELQVFTRFFSDG